jgi:hypothetical protein
MVSLGSRTPFVKPVGKHIGHKFTTTTRRQIAKAYLQGESGERLAQQHGTTGETIRSWIRSIVQIRTCKKKPVFLSAEQRAQISKRYANGATMTTLAADLDVDISTIGYILHKSGVPVRRRRRISQVIQKKVVAAYLSGLGSPTIARRLDVPVRVVCSILHRHEIQARPRTTCRKYSLDETVFKNPKADEKAAYWIGFLMADGSVVRNGKQKAVVLALSSRDKKHVSLFRAFLKTNAPVRTYQSKIVFKTGVVKIYETAMIRANSTKLAESLIKHGVVQRKTWTGRLTTLATSRHAWRGVVDGDGTVSFAKRDKPLICLCGASRVLLEQFADFCRRIVPDCLAKVRAATKGGWFFSIQGHRAAKVIRVLYHNCSVALERKLKTAKIILARYQKELPKRCHLKTNSQS